MAKNSIYNKIKNTLSVVLVKDQDRPNGSLAFADILSNIDDPNKPFAPLDVKSDTDLQRKWNWYINQTYQDQESYKNRQNRIKDLQFIIRNDAYIGRASELYADEAVQSDSQDRVIQVESTNSKFTKFSYDFFENIGASQTKLKDVALNLATFGDGFWANAIDAKKGITKIFPVDQTAVEDRLEFSLSHVYDQYVNKMGDDGIKTKSVNSYLNDLYTIYKSDNNLTGIAEKFVNFMFGYVVTGKAVPPWEMTHFRRFSSESEFFPFGKSLFIHAVAPYRQLSTSMNLQAMARMSSFPLTLVKILTSEGMTKTEKFLAVNEVRQLWYNQVQQNTGRDAFAVNQELFYPDGLMEVDTFSPNVDFKDIDDLEFLQDRLIIALGIPKGYLRPEEGNFGTSGVALLRQSKPFARSVYSLQQPIIEELTALLKLHCLLTGEFVDEDFKLSLSFPNIEEDSDRQQHKSDSINLVKDVIGAISDSLTLDSNESLPPDIVRDIFKRYSFIDDEDVDKWINMQDIDKYNTEKAQEKYNEYFSPETFKNSMDYVIKKNNRGKFEGVKDGRHFIESTQVCKERNLNAYVKCLKGNPKKLNS